MKSRVFGIVVMLCAFAQVSMAQNEAIKFIECSWNTETKEVVKTEKTCTDYTVLSGQHPSDWIGLDDGKWYVVKDDGVTYKTINVLGNAHLILCDGARISLTGGVKLEGDRTLTIYGQTKDSGTLHAECTDYSSTAGIGSAEGTACGNLTVHGGFISGEGSDNAAGIGGGEEANSGSVIIYGGSVIASGGNAAAGIGGGKKRGIGGSVTIYGGKVISWGGDYGAGIGGGDEGNQGGDVDIYGGEVYTYGKYYTYGFLNFEGGGAGIGGGDEGEGGNVNIYGGNISAYGRGFAAGIGGGQNRGIAGNAKVRISGGTVLAYGYDPSVTFTEDRSGAGIGGGSGGDQGGDIIITGGNVTAKGGKLAAGIGGGAYSGGGAIGGKVTITGGKVTATCGEGTNSSEAGGGCAIGCAKWRDKNTYAGTLIIGDSMMVKSGDKASNTNRESYCRWKWSVTIEPCDHEGSAYTVSGSTANDTHTLHCSYCTYQPTSEHVFNETNICTVCGVGASTKKISIYLPDLEDGYTDGKYAASIDQQFVEGASFELPAPPVSYEPMGLTFAGWLVGTPKGTYFVADDEEILSAGTPYTVSADVSLTARYKGKDLILANEDYNSEVLSQNAGSLVQNVTLSGRTLYKDGSWNTLCLPFDIENIEKTPLVGADVRKLEDARFEDGTLTLNFSDVGLDSISAGVPYLVKWDNGKEVADPVFRNVVIKTDKHPVEVKGVVSFVGTYDPVNIGEDGDRSILYLSADNTLYYPNSKMTIGSFRAYFQLDGHTAGDISEASVRITFGGEETGIDSVPVESEGVNSDWYTLDGRRLSAKPAKRGIYMNNGQKVIIK